MKTIGKYQILGLLGRGGMGVVYKARHPELGRIVALKLLAPMDMVEAIVGMEELTRRFMAEARAMAGLHHPNIASVWDLEEDAQGRPFFVMDYHCNNVGALIGETYRVEAESRVLRLDRAADIVRQCLLGLARLHAAGVVHRDMKPFNLLLTAEGGVRIIDFGLSKLRGERLVLHGAEKVGSPYYAAPEQEADPEAAGPESDLYSVGVMLSRMLTGHLPQLAQAAPSALNPDLDEQWDGFLARATAEAPGERFATAQAMIDELDRLVADWRERTQGVCALPPDAKAADAAGAADADSAVGAGSSTSPSLRSIPMKTGPKAGPDSFGLDELWRPQRYAENGFVDLGDGTVRHEQTGLVWERGGSDFALTREEAGDHVRELNQRAFAGFSDWRLPSVPELMTLLTPVTQGRDFCVAPAFDTQPRLWSADRRSYVQSWTANTELGFIGRHDHTCLVHARAVRSAG